jgi:CMP-N-acetylneuraminic acid synthetase
MIDKVNYKSRTHDLKKIFHGAGQFYWGKVDSWLKKNFYIHQKVLDLICQDVEPLMLIIWKI